MNDFLSLIFFFLFGLVPLAFAQSSCDEGLDAITPRQEVTREYGKQIERLERHFGSMGVPLGKGAQGSVWKFVDASGKTHVFKTGEKTILEQEARVLNLLNQQFEKQNPGAPSPFPKARYDDQLAALELEEARGNLEALLSQFGPPAMEASVNAIEEIARAVEFANSQNIIHLDLKLPNVLVSPPGHLWLSDWGLATEKGFGTGLGTPGYNNWAQRDNYPANAEMDAVGLRVVAMELLLGRDLHDDKLRKAGLTGSRLDPDGTAHPAFRRSPHGTDPRVPKALSVAVWRHAKSAEELRKRVALAKQYSAPGDEKAFFERFSPELERAIAEDPRRFACEFVTSIELMEAAQKGWLKLSPKAKAELLTQSAQLYRLPSDKSIPADYPWPPISDSPLRAQVLRWEEYERFGTSRRWLHDRLWGTIRPPF